MFLGSRKNPCYLCDFFLSLEFCFIGFSTHAIFASDCLTKFSVNYFLFENCGENLLTRSFLDINIKHYHKLVLTDPDVLGNKVTE